jgi:2-succinyl-5-enolpyruvyl-6-hydroxy-3-cyclohexene-1-carboxylate synthase
VAKALLTARGALSGDPGPVHLNLPFREPLLPEDADVRTTGPWCGRPDGAPWTDGSAAAVTRPADTGPARTLVVVGDAPPALGRVAAELAGAQGWPVVAEPSSGAWAGSVRGGALLLGVSGWLAAHRPDRVLVVGRPTLSRPVSALLADPAVRVESVSAAPRWPDAGRSTTWVGTLPSSGAPADPAWREAWCDAAARVGTAVDGVLDALPTLTAGLLARDLVAALPDGALLVLGSSTPVRDVDRLAVPRAGLTVLANRGVAGIDGTVSTAVGAALVHSRGDLRGDRRAFALLGDLTFLHDLQGLLIGEGERRPDLTLVVPDNDGGGIFAQLEPGQSRYESGYRRVFGTPHGRDLVAVAEALGWPAQRVSSSADLRDAVHAGGPRVVVVGTDQRAEAELTVRLRSAAAEALGGA